MTKMAKLAKIDTLFMTKTAENHTLWGRTYLYCPYKGVTPRATTGHLRLSRLRKTGAKKYRYHEYREERFVFEMFLSHTKTPSRRLKIPPVYM